MLSVLGTDRLYPQENIACTHFCQGQSVARRIMSLKNSKFEPSTFRLVAQRLTNCATLCIWLGILKDLQAFCPVLRNEKCVGLLYTALSCAAHCSCVSLPLL